MIMLLNPRKRKKSKKASKKRSTRKHVSRKHSRKAKRRIKRVSTATCGRRVSVWKKRAARWQALFRKTRAKRHIPAGEVGGWKYAHTGDNPRRRKRSKKYSYRKNYSTWIPAFGSNGGAVANLTGGVKSAFKPSIFVEAAPVLGGFLASKYIAGIVGKQSFVPSFLKSGIGSYALDGISAGLAYMLTNAIAPKYAKNVLLGGAVQVAGKVLNAYVIPDSVKSMLADDMDGMEDYLSVASAQAPNLRPLGEYLTVGAAQQNALRPLGDYLTVGAAQQSALRQLNGFGLGAEGEELMGEYLTSADVASAVEHPF